MDKQSIDEHIDAKLALMMVDSTHTFDGTGHSERDIAENTGLSTYEVWNIQKAAFDKLKKDPEVWELVTRLYR